MRIGVEFDDIFSRCDEKKTGRGEGKCKCISERIREDDIENDEYCIDCRLPRTWFENVREKPNGEKCVEHEYIVENRMREKIPRNHRKKEERHKTRKRECRRCEPGLGSWFSHRLIIAHLDN